MADNLMASAPGGNLVYDALDRLQKIGGAGTILCYQGANVVTEHLNSGGTVQRRYVPGDAPDETLVWFEGSGNQDRRWLHADERGSTIAVSDGNGNARTVAAYDEFGTPSNPDDAELGRFRYTGQMWLSEIRGYYYKARMYSPNLGRFFQTDPIGYADGMNLYAYVGNDPVNGTDPTGTKTVDASHPNNSTGGGSGAGGSGSGSGSGSGGVGGGDRGPLPTFTGSLIPGVVPNGLQINGVDANAVQLSVMGLLSDLTRNLSPTSAGGPVQRGAGTQPRDPVNFSRLSAADLATARSILADSSIRSDIFRAWTSSLLTGNEYDFKIYQKGTDFVSRFSGSGTISQGSQPNYHRVEYENRIPLFLEGTFHTHPGNYANALYPSYQDVTVANPFNVIVFIGVRQQVDSNRLRVIYGK